ncbi:AAA family ATPase [Streptomyces sp. NPDC002537]
MDVLHSPQLAERDAELAVLDALLSEAGAGHGSVALISGPAGSGKTHMLRTFCKRAENPDGFLLTAVASRDESELPLGLMDQLFRCAKLPLEFRRRVNALLADELSAGRGTSAGPVTMNQMNQPSLKVANGLRSLLLELSEHGPVVVSIDDLHYADGPSLQMLLFLQRRMKTSRILLLLAEQSTVRSPHPVFHAELFRQPNCRKIRLGMLTRSGVRSMIEARLGPARARELTGPYHEASGGSPLFLSALLDDYEALHRLGLRHDSEPALSQAAFRNALTDCLYLAEPVALDVARAVAALGTAGSSVLIGRILAMNTSTVDHAIASLTATGLLDSEDFRHPAARTAVLEEMPPDTRHELHLRVANALHYQGTPALPVAEQLVAAGRAPEAWMIHVLRDAARCALAAGRTAVACEYLDLALKDCLDNRQLAELTADRMRIEWQKSPLKAMRHVEPLQNALRAGHLAGHDAGLLARSLLWHGRYREAREALTLWKADDTASDRAESEELTALTAWMAHTYPSLVAAPGGPATVPEAETGPDAARPFGRHAVNVLTRLLADGADDTAVARAEAILHSVVLSSATLESLYAALLTLLCADRPDKAASWCEELLKEAEQQEMPTWQAVFAAVRADAAFRQGDMATAVQQGEAALSRIPASAWGVTIGSPLASLILATAMMGQHDKAVEYVRLPVPDAMFETRYGLLYLNARGHFHLSTDRPAAALTDFESCGRLMTAWGLDLPSLVPWRSGAAEAALALGYRSRAQALVEEQLTRPGTQQPRTRGASLRLLAATRDLEERPALLRQAVDLLRPDTGRFELARALTDLRDAYEALGDHQRSGEAAHRAAEMMKSCHIPTEWAQPTPVVRPPHSSPAVAPSGPARSAGQPEPVAPHGRQDAPKPAGADALSDAERRVAELAAVGVTNRAIGRKLFITVSTVEQHLTRVYRKLDVSRRRDLAAKLDIDLPDVESA